MRGSSDQTRFAYPDGRPTELVFDREDSWDYVGAWAPDGRRYFFEGAGGIYDLDLKRVSDEGWGQEKSLPRWSLDGRTMVWTTTQEERHFEIVRGLK